MLNRNPLYLLVASALCFGVTETGSIGSQKIAGWDFDAEHVKSWTEEGKKAGTFAQNVFSTAESSVMKMMLTVASKIAGTPSAEDFLTGYSMAWKNPDTAKSRKTDFRAVMDAYGLKDASGKAPFEYEKVVDWEKNPDGTAKLDADKNPILIKATKTAAQWLEEYEGDFKGFLALAREIRNRGTGRASQGTGASRKTKVTDAQLSTIMQQIPVMNANQAQVTIVEATKQMSKLPNWEYALLAQMELLANQLKASKQPIFVEAAAKLFDVLGPLREEVRSAQELQAKASADALSASLGGKAPQGDFKPPVPAHKEQKAA